MKPELFGIISLFVTVSLIPSQVVAQNFQGLQGGDSYEKAVPIQAGVEYRLDHQQRKGQFDYFALNLKGGQTVTVTVTASSYAGVQIHDASRNRLGGFEIAGETNTRKSIEVDASVPQRLYLLLGSVGESMHKDHVTFRLEIRSNFDAGLDADAGGSPGTALNLRKDRNYLENYLTKNDEADFYRIPTARGERVAVTLLPDNLRSTIVAALYDELKTELAQVRSINPGAGVSLAATATGDVTYLKVSREFSDEPTRYAILFPEELPPVVKAAVKPEIDYRPKFLRSNPP